MFNVHCSQTIDSYKDMTENAHQIDKKKFYTRKQETPGPHRSPEQ